MRLPPAAELAELPLHVLVRDFPETLTLLRRSGVDVAARGGDTVAEAAGAALAPLCEAMYRAGAWREHAPPGPCDRQAARAAALQAAQGD